MSSSSESEETETEPTTAKASPEMHDAQQPASLGSKHHHLYRSHSHSPSGCDVQILDPDLTCIGLQDDNADVWGLKIMKLVAFPDLITGPHIAPSPSSSPEYRRRSLTVADLTSAEGLGVSLADDTDLVCHEEAEDGDVEAEADRLGDSESESSRAQETKEFVHSRECSLQTSVFEEK